MVSSCSITKSLQAVEAKKLFTYKVKLTILIIHIALSVSGQGKEVLSLPNSAFPYKTIFLKNDYRLLKITNNNQCIFHLIGPGVDTIISKSDSADDQYSIGHLIGDEEEFFIMMFPELNVKIFSKRTGSVLIDGWFVERDDVADILYYIDHQKDDSLGIFDLKTMRVELFPSIVTSCSEHWWFCIKNKFLSEGQLVLEYRGPEDKILRKAYIR